MDNREVMPGAPLPSSTEAEISVLGAMLQDKGAVLRASEQLRQEDFYLAEHQEIFSAMLELDRSHVPVDLVTLHAELARRGSLEGVGGDPYLLQLITRVPTAANVQAYIDLVKEKSTLRRLIRAAKEIAKDCYTQSRPVQETLAGAEKAIFDIAMNRAEGDALKPLREVLFSTYAEIEELARNPGGISGVPTGFIDLDNLLTGLHGGELIVLGARPSMGKTSLAMNIAGNACLHGCKAVAVFTLEMPREQIAMRLLCSEARVDMQSVRKGTLTDGDWMKLARTLGVLANTKMYIDDTAGITPGQLRSRCQRLMMDDRLDLVVLDYLGLMHADSRVENRTLEVSEISRQLKAIALELKIPIVACAQLSRANRDRPDKRPLLSDLRDSGSIEQDADVVMFLHREEYYNKDTEDKNIGEVIVAKQRSGPLGTVRLAWLSEYTTFATLSRENEGSPAPY